jgi:biopolymer transport protein ExbD
MKVPRPAARKVRIEMLPLIDVVFLLLVVFIYTMLSMAVHRGMPVDLPVSDVAEINNDSQISVTVKADGVLFLDKQETDLELLTLLLKQKAESNTRLLLFADKKVSYQQLFQVMDRIKLAGIESISLQAMGTD